nr:sensor histidine kinase [Oceanobacillus saliphilus]
MGKRALHVATAVSFMPTIREAFDEQNPSEIIQPIAEEIRGFLDAEFIVIGNAESIRYSHPNENQIGERMVGDDNDPALIDGEYYISSAEGTLGPSLRGKAPIIGEDGSIIGIVSVGFLREDIESIIWQQIQRISFIALGVLLIGTLGGIILARNIRKDTFGLEPHEIASLYRNRDAILTSVKEGIIAIDQTGNINMINESARKILHLHTNNKAFSKIEDVIPNTKMYDVLRSGVPVKDDEMIINNRSIIVNRTPIKNKDDEVIGVVSSFRDKTEMNEMLATLSEMRSYSEDLRAQTHEYTNKLYVLSGLLQLEYYEEAIDLIQQESEINIKQNKLLIEQIQDKTVQSILLGKISKCSEKKIDFIIDTNSYLHELPDHINALKLIAILGNLIDNAIEAIEYCEEREIRFFATDIGNEIVFEIADSGNGVKEEDIENIFEQGYSTKDKGDRGYGLNIVKEAVEDLSGGIVFDHIPDGGTVFTVFFPKAK